MDTHPTPPPFALPQANFFPNHLAWFKANFALCMGPLCTAVLTWHNSLVFHSLEKLTSFFLHVFPPMLCHLYRWRLIPTDTIEKEMSWEYSDLILPSMGMYIVWQISYLLLTGAKLGGKKLCFPTFGYTFFFFFFSVCNYSEVVYREALDADPSMITSIRWLVRDRRNPINKLVTQGCRSYGIIKDGEYLDPEVRFPEKSPRQKKRVSRTSFVDLSPIPCLPLPGHVLQDLVRDHPVLLHAADDAALLLRLRQLRGQRRVAPLHLPHRDLERRHLLHRDLQQEA